MTYTPDYTPKDYTISEVDGCVHCHSLINSDTARGGQREGGLTDHELLGQVRIIHAMNDHSTRPADKIQEDPGFEVVKAHVLLMQALGA